VHANLTPVPGPIVIVGAGQAGVQVAESLRHDKYDGPIALLGAEAHGPYNRPPLSKKWLLEGGNPASLAIRTPEVLERRRIELHTNVVVTQIDRDRRLVQCADGRQFPYGGLALATGARLRHLSVPGTGWRGVLGLRTLEDATHIAAALDACAATQSPLVVIGGGFIGLEVAAAARKRGVAVTVLEGLERLMSRVVAPIVSGAAAQLHRAHGVELVFNARVAELVGAGEGEDRRVRAVRMADGHEYRAGCVVVGIGVDPEDTLARAAGLECDRGIIVDDCARSSDPRIVAAGDCCARRQRDGTLLRLESVQNAVEQGMSAAAALLGQERPMKAAPWFWSDQYDARLQMVGLSQGYDEVVTRGEVAQLAFSAFYYRGGRLIAVDSLNNVPMHMLGRRLLDRGLSPTPAQAADANFNLQDLLAA
jgi:3-phenylpropionate/trans-cinnamate dioxygenase ferredoxin reductase component